jgi:hypothetical protein
MQSNYYLLVRIGFPEFIPLSVLKSTYPRKRTVVTQFFFYSYQLVKLCNSLTAATAPCFQMPGSHRNCQICNRCIFRFTASV